MPSCVNEDAPRLGPFLAITGENIGSMTVSEDLHQKPDWKLIPGIMLAVCTMCKQLTWWIRENPWDDRRTGDLADTELRVTNLDVPGVVSREQVSGNGSPILPGVVYTQGGLGIHREDWVSIFLTHRPRHQKELLSFRLLAARLHRQGDWMQKSSPTSRKLLQCIYKDFQIGRGRPHQQHAHKTS